MKIIKGSLAVFVASFVVLPTVSMKLSAQRTTAELKWQKKHVTITYGPVRFGKHSLTELPVRTEWRMGMNTASTIATDVPLVGARGLVAPGSYRASLYRGAEKELGLMVIGTGLATAGTAAYFPTDLVDAERSDKLHLSWLEAGEVAGKSTRKTPPRKPLRKGKPKRNSWGGDPKTTAAPVNLYDGKTAKRTTLRLGFGPFRLDMPVAMIGAQAVKVRGFRGDAFQWPSALFAAQVKAGHTIPILTLRAPGGSKSRPNTFNLLVNDQLAEFRPAMVAPTESYGFAGVKGLDGDEIMRGTIQWSDVAKAIPHLEVSGLKVKNRQLQLTVKVGKKVAKIAVPVPRRK